MSLKIHEKSSMFQWFAILAFKKVNIEKSFKNLDRSDKTEGFTKIEHAKNYPDEVPTTFVEIVSCCDDTRLRCCNVGILRC